MVCKTCQHIHCFKDHCGLILSGDECAGIIYDECACQEIQNMENVKNG